MKGILVIALNHLRLLSKDKSTYLLLIALPLALTLITGFALGGGGSPGGPFILNLGVVDHDNSGASRYLVDSWQTDGTALHPLEEERARELVEERSISGAVIIPEGFQRYLMEGRTGEITVLRADLLESPRIVEQLVNSSLFRLRANSAAALLGVEFSRRSWPELFNLAAEKWEPSPPVTVEMESLTITGDTQIPMGNQQASPGYVVMFGMMTVIAAGAGTLLEERRNKTLARLLSAPVNRFQLLTGKLLGIMGSGLFQMLLMIAAGQLIFNVNWGQSLMAVILLAAALSFAATGFGMLLASLCRTQGQAESLGVFSVVVMSMLGGTWWPVELLPSYLQTLSKMVPSGWAMQGFIDITFRGAGLAQVGLPLAALVGFGAAFLAAGVFFFRFE